MSWARRVGALALALVTLAGATACGSADPERPDLTLFSQLSGREADALERTLEPFTAETGITVRLVSSTDFEADLVDRVQAGDPPDLALVPQPGLLRGLQEQLGAPLAVPGPVQDVVRANYDDFWIEQTEVDGRMFGVVVQASAKSLVWYSPSQFAARGHEVPTSWAELQELLRTMVDEDRGVIPWCIGFRDGDASGWVGTDWVEDLVLRPVDDEADAGATFDAWVAGEVDFADERIVAALDEAGAIALSSALASPPPRTILTTPVDEAANGLLGDDPSCLLHRQASFTAGWVPSSTTFGPDGDLDVFALPDRDGGPAPMLMGGQIAVAFRDRPEAWALLEYLATPEGVQQWAQLPGYLAPHETFPVGVYRSELDQRIVGMVDDASVLRFDGSDQMPYEVGIGSFWSGMVSFVGGAPTSVVVSTIDATWPDDGDPLGLHDVAVADEGQGAGGAGG